MISQVLSSLGLTDEEVAIYESLITNGAQTASELSRSSKVQRTYVYRIAEQLVAKQLIGIEKKDGKTRYIPGSPEMLSLQAQTQKQKALQAEQALSELLPALKEKYKLVEARPIISYFEGIVGLKKVYEDIINTKKDILLFRSVHDNQSSKLTGIIEDQIKKQVSAGIRTKTITPLATDTKDTYMNEDTKRLVTRHIVNNQLFNLPAQIIIYGTKTAIISLKSEIIITLIDNDDIAQTFCQLFELNWMLTQQEHNLVVSAWAKK